MVVLASLSRSYMVGSAIVCVYYFLYAIHDLSVASDYMACILQPDTVAYRYLLYGVVFFGPRRSCRADVLT